MNRKEIPLLVGLIVALFLFCVDRITKMLALKYLSNDQTVIVIPRLLSFHLVRNQGAALGMFSSTTTLITIVTWLVVVLLCVALWYTTSWQWAIIIGCGIAGAAGNGLDRILYAPEARWLNGPVIDFLDYGWSVGNVADICLIAAVLGAVICAILNIRFIQYRTKDGKNLTAFQFLALKRMEREKLSNKQAMNSNREPRNDNVRSQKLELESTSLKEINKKGSFSASSSSKKRRKSGKTSRRRKY